MSTMIRAIREGSELTQIEAARAIGIKAPTLAAYEGGRFVPSPSKTMEVARALALGKPSVGEKDPRFVVTYWLFGQRILADDLGRMVVFRDPAVAHTQVERLERSGFLDVAIVPLWRGRRRVLREKLGAPAESTGEDLGDPLKAVLEYADKLAAEYDRLAAESMGRAVA